MDRRRLTDFGRVALVACVLLFAKGSVVATVAQEPSPPATAPQERETEPAPIVTAPLDSAAEPTPAPTPAPVTLPAAQAAPVVVAANGTALRLYMPDGQLISHRLSVYVTGNLQERHKPVLTLFRSHALTTREADEEKPLVPT